MKVLSTLFCLFLSFSAFAQNVFYQSFEVDSTAEPRGGMVYLNLFLQTNLRKPIAAEAQGVGGRVIVSGIVETDGRITEAKVTGGFRPDCDREALRVFKLFNAWKPASKDGKLVRQQLNIPVTFKPNAPFLYEGGARINYFDASEKPLVDSTKARYKQVSPVDSIGMPIGDIHVYKFSRGSWKEERLIPLVREESGVRNELGKMGYLVGYPNSIIRMEGLLVSTDNKGAMLHQAYFQNGRRVGTELTYHPNGIVTQKIEEFEEEDVETSWYPNGQIRQIQAIPNYKPGIPGKPNRVLAHWNYLGHQFVKDGSGSVSFETQGPWPSNTNPRIPFIEAGSYENGLKQGIWTGRFADSSYSYEEEYDKGNCQAGKAVFADGTMFRYTEIEKQPEFKGGMEKLGEFLSQSLRYPIYAQRARVQGKVLVAFIIETDGSINDVNVQKGIGYGADEEAVRVVKSSSGLWKPGVQRGRNVRVKYNLPINFTLQ